MMPLHCPVDTDFPAGTRTLSPAELQAAGVRFDGPVTRHDIAVAQWEGAGFLVMCLCNSGTDFAAELSAPGASTEFAQAMFKGLVSGEIVSLRTRSAPSPSPGLDAVALRSNPSQIIRTRAVGLGSCMYLGAAVEPNPAIREYRATMDRWFESWRLPGGRPLALIPLSEEWDRRRFD
jgi:hypothetical protein